MTEPDLELLSIPDLRRIIVERGLNIGLAHNKSELIKVLSRTVQEDVKIKVVIIPPLPERLISMDRLPVIRPFRETVVVPRTTTTSNNKIRARASSPVKLPSEVQQRPTVRPPQISKDEILPPVVKLRPKTPRVIKTPKAEAPARSISTYKLPTARTVQSVCNVSALPAKVPTVSGKVKVPTIRRPVVTTAISRPVISATLPQVTAPAKVRSTLASIKSPKRAVVRSPKTPSARRFTAASPRIASPRATRKIVKYDEE